ncbi:cyclin-dependent kinase inhibitor 6-like [Salvia hispanica]|uniref:cyclin-dependent kinase inhibitor 6-like n=1 Tax=Salvia hispanica TaxID=49212 RepID=UPI0020097C9E|nr:cyclin-dependent kinase inhibitor 6-like [Salvia hispanica]
MRKSIPREDMQISLYCVFGDAELASSPDLEAARSGREISTSACVNFSEATRQVVVKEKLKSVGKTPSAAELEDFFTEAEDYVQRRFAQKYNYDIVKDAPIQGGRYQWVPNPTHI